MEQSDCMYSAPLEFYHEWEQLLNKLMKLAPNQQPAASVCGSWDLMLVGTRR